MTKQDEVSQKKTQREQKHWTKENPRNILQRLVWEGGIEETYCSNERLCSYMSILGAKYVETFLNMMQENPTKHEKIPFVIEAHRQHHQTAPSKMGSQ